MPSTYSPNLRLELIGDGEQEGYWGRTTNRTLGTFVENALGGTLRVDVTDNVTLSANEGASDQARFAVLVAHGAPVATRTITVPNARKIYWVSNTTDQTVRIATVAGAYYDCPKKSVNRVIFMSSTTATGITVTQEVVPLLASNNPTYAAMLYGYAPINTPALDGVPTAPHPPAGDVSNKIATKQHVDDTLVAYREDAALTGIPLAPTAATNINTTQIATTRFVNAYIASKRQGSVPPGTRMLFVSTVAPVGWEKDGTINDRALRVVSGKANISSQITSFFHTFGRRDTGLTAIDWGEMPTHTHTGTTDETSDTHTHNYSATVGSAGDHTHNFACLFRYYQSNRPGQITPANPDYAAYQSGVFELDRTSSTGAHSHAYSVTTSAASVAAHKHSVSASTAGGGAGHSHALDFQLSYVDVIIARKI